MYIESSQAFIPFAVSIFLKTILVIGSGRTLYYLLNSLFKFLQLEYKTPTLAKPLTKDNKSDGSFSENDLIITWAYY